ncbi:MAG: glycosyltransferase family 2 protein [Legionellales bacterium]|nr:glycosyltransferase family 2 protein [Legionellales bacterium]
MVNTLVFLSFIIIIYFSILWVGYLGLLLGTFSAVIRKYQESENNTIFSTYGLHEVLPMTLIIPAYNEAKRILSAVTSILNSDYQDIHLIIVNDGSTDTMVQVLLDTYAFKEIPPAFRQTIPTGAVRAYYRSEMVPNFTLIDKVHSPFANSGADCINAGLNICTTPVFLTIDADTLLEEKALSQMLFMYLTHPHCVAVGGDIYVPDTIKMKDGKVTETNIPSNFVLGVQVCEYLRSFSYGREGWSLIGGALCFPGAFTLLETKAVWDIGGYDSSNFSYDAEIIIRLHHEMRKNHYPYSMVYAPSAICWSEEPSTLIGLWKQRNKWQRGLLRCLGRHLGMLFNPRYGIVGLLGFPYYVLFEIFGPAVEAFSYLLFIVAYCIGAISIVPLAWLICLAWGYMWVITMSCVVLNVLTYNVYYRKMDIVRIFGLTTIDMMFYRQWRAFCALFSSIQYVVNRLRGKCQ